MQYIRLSLKLIKRRKQFLISLILDTVAARIKNIICFKNILGIIVLKVFLSKTGTKEF